MRGIRVLLVLFVLFSRESVHISSFSSVSSESFLSFLVVACRFQRVAVIVQSLGLHKKLKFGRRAAVSGSKEKLNKAKDRVLSTHSLEHSFEEVS